MLENPSDVLGWFQVTVAECDSVTHVQRLRRGRNAGV